MVKERKINKDRAISVGLLLLILFPIEVVALETAWETLGEVRSGFLLIGCIILNSFALFFSFVRFWPSIFLMSFLGIWIIWHQLILVVRLHYVGAEAANIVCWVYTERLKTGMFPDNLNDYNFTYPKYKQYIYDYKLFDKNHFRLTYYVGVSTTLHGYDSEGGWSYYPD